MKKTFKNSKGITLVALVITIIILLILAGISISALTNTGIFQKAKDAKQKSENAALDQNTKLDEYENEIDKYIPKANSLAKAVKVGDYVAYTPDEPDNSALDKLKENLNTYSGASDNTTNSAIARDSLSWRVLDIDEKTGVVRLISATPTNKSIKLEGYNGYNNAVKLLDDACSTLYNSKLATKVQNLKIEDITKHMTTQPTEDTTEYHPEDINYPKILEQEKNQTVVKSTTENKLGVSSQSIFVTGYDTSVTSTLKNNYWYKTMSANDFDGENKEMYYKLFINNGSNYPTYWMSSRCVRANSDFAYFSVHYVNSGRVGADNLYNYEDFKFPHGYAFRPVITLNSNVQVTSGNGTESTPFEIK